jgi:diguanylate cyclase (GGDEF)-like protein/PAS domain S-box-containing protein
LYGGYAAVLALAPSSRGTPPLAYLAAATALNCGLFGFFLHWSSSETSWTRWLGFLTASLSVLNPLAHLFLVRDPIQTTHLIFILLGASFALSSTLRFILVWTISLSAWFVIATPSLQFTEWRFYSYALAAGAFGSLAIQIARAAAHRRALATPAAELFDGEKFGAGSDRLQLAVRGTDDGLWCWDLATDELHLSPRWKSMLGYDAGDVDDKLDEWFSRVHPYYHPALKGALADHIRGDTDQFELQYRIRHRDGTYRWVLSRGTAERDSEGKVLRIGGSQTDITALIEVEKHLIHDALHDTLTGLPNRGFLMRQLETITDRQCLFAVLFMDLDRFKSINDSLGHEVGDQLLMETAKRLNSCARSGDTVARLGGDEFVIVLSGLRKPEDAEQLARRIQEAMQAPLELAGNELSLSASIGIAIADGRSSTDQLLRNADIAMYEAKTDAGKIRVFSPDMQGRRVHSRQLQDDLRQAKRKAG